MTRFIIGIGIAIGLVLVVWFGLLPVEQYLLETVYEFLPIAGIKQTDWLQHFFDAGVFCMITALVFAVFWQLFGQFANNISSNLLESCRGVWVSFLLLMILFVLITGYFLNLPTQDSGRYIASIFYAINGFIIYYFSSLFSSPTNVKFAPIGTIQLYKINFLQKLLK